jgi:hypothetical protein
MSVTGDFGNWIFCREFHPSRNGYVSDNYWIEKLEIYSVQKGRAYDRDGTVELLESLDENDLLESGYSAKNIADIKEYYEDLLSYASDNEFDYLHELYDRKPDCLECDELPIEESIHKRLKIVFDAFEEICKRFID